MRTCECLKCLNPPCTPVILIQLPSVAFYRSSAREVKRLDAMTRSLLYSHFSER